MSTKLLIPKNNFTELFATYTPIEYLYTYILNPEYSISNNLAPITIKSSTNTNSSSHTSEIINRIQRLNYDLLYPRSSSLSSVAYTDDLYNMDIADAAKLFGVLEPINNKIVSFGTSAIRDPNATYGAKNSYHKKKDQRTGLAMARDVTIKDGTEKDYNDWVIRTMSNEGFVNYLEAIGWGFLPEISKTLWEKWGTAPNVHFSPGDFMISNRNKAKNNPNYIASQVVV